MDVGVDVNVSLVAVGNVAPVFNVFCLKSDSRLVLSCVMVMQCRYWKKIRENSSVMQ